MRTEIVVALIAAGGLILAPIIATYFVNRQSANDLRTNIDREIDIIRKLRPDSQEAAKLGDHVSASIDALIFRDERRDRFSRFFRLFGPLYAVSLAVYGLNVWREHGVPKDLKGPVEGLFWSLLVVELVLFGLLVCLAVWVSYWAVRRWITQAQLRWARRKLAQLELDREELKRQHFEMRAYTRQLMETMTAHKDEIIENAGQEWWDDMMKRREELDRKGDEIEEQLKADEPSNEEPPAPSPRPCTSDPRS